MTTRRSDPDRPKPRPHIPIESAMNVLVALLVQPDERTAAQFENIFQAVACDWRLVRVADGAAATRYIVQKGLPELLITAARVPQVSGSDLVEWLRSFRCSSPVPVLIYDAALDEATREWFLRNHVKAILGTDSPASVLSEQLEHLVSVVEKRRYSNFF